MSVMDKVTRECCHWARWAVQSFVTHSCVTCLFHVWHDAFIYAMTLLPLGSATELGEQHSFVTHSCVTWLVHVWHDSFACAMTLLPLSSAVELSRWAQPLSLITARSWHIWMSHFTYEWVMSHMIESCHIWMGHVTHEWVMSHINESCHIWMSRVTHEWIMSHITNECCSPSLITARCVCLYVCSYKLVSSASLSPCVCIVIHVWHAS